jgi:NAD+ synthetase
VAPLLGPEEEVYAALTTGLRDYVDKNGFGHVVLGLSGGIDSALVATLAVDALGPSAVRALAMPSPYSSPGSVSDAKDASDRLGIRLDVIGIADAFAAHRQALEPVFEGRPEDVAEENVQARVRGTLLMAMSNKLGSMVLAPGNKSEYAVGYATLYGDMAGGYAPIKDIPKTLVFELSRWRNARARATGEREPIPQAIVDKAPSAELRPDQKDTDSLPPYEELDPVIEAYVEHDLGVDDMVAQGVDRALAERVVRMIDRAEYKRRQAAPGVKITPKAFGRDRRMPITNRYPG